MTVLAVPSSPASAGSSSSGRLPALDGLRGLAALLVVFGHWVTLGMAADYGTPLYLLKRIFWLNASGVDLFFVLSGFLIGGILIDRRASPNLLRIFWLRRAARILPLFVLFLATFAVLCRWPGSHPLLAANTQPLWIHGLFLSNLWTTFTGHWDQSFLSITWSLAIEEQVYLALPLMVLAFTPLRLRRALLAALLVAPVLRCSVWIIFGEEFSLAAHMFTPCRADAFAAGIWIAQECRQPRPIWQDVPVRRILFAGAPAALVLVWLTRHNEWMGSLIYCAVGYTACTWFYGTCLLLALISPRLATVFAWSPLAWVGRHSYFIYLFHGIVSVLVSRLGAIWLGVDRLGDAWHLLASCVLLVLLAAASMRWFEAPLLRRGHRHTYAIATAYS